MELVISVILKKPKKGAMNLRVLGKKVGDKDRSSAALQLNRFATNWWVQPCSTQQADIFNFFKSPLSTRWKGRWGSLGSTLEVSCFRWVSEFYFTRDENMIDMIDQTSKTNLTGIAAKNCDKIPWWFLSWNNPRGPSLGLVDFSW